MSPICIERRIFARPGSGPAALGCTGGFVFTPLLLLVAGCQTILPRSRLTVPPVPQGNAALMQYIADLPFVTAEASYRGIILVADGKAYAGEFEPLRNELVKRGIVGSTWNHHSDTLMNRAGVAYMVCKACNIRRGVNWLLLDQGRYAWRELQHMRIGGPGSELGNLSGGEFLGILSRADKYVLAKKRKDGGDNAPKLGDEPAPSSGGR